jgi:hypothetical protein
VHISAISLGSPVFAKASAKWRDLRFSQLPLAGPSVERANHEIEKQSGEDDGRSHQGAAHIAGEGVVEQDRRGHNETIGSTNPLQPWRHWMVRGIRNQPPTIFNDDRLVARYIS